MQDKINAQPPLIFHSPQDFRHLWVDRVHSSVKELPPHLLHSDQRDSSQHHSLPGNEVHSLKRSGRSQSKKNNDNEEGQVR